MKGSLKNNLKNVYKPINNNNVGVNKNIKNITNRLKNNNLYNNFIDNGKNVENVINSNIKNVSNSNNKNYNLYIILIIVVCLLILLLLFLFKDDIINYFKNLFKDTEIDDKIKNLEDISENNSKLISKEIKDLDDKLELLKKEKKEKKKEKKENEEKKEEKKENEEYDNLLNNKKTDDLLNIQYDKSNIINEDSYCYIGSDDNTRHCVKAYSGEICSSGDIYKRLDKCLIPDLRIHGIRSKKKCNEKKVDINNNTGISNIMFNNMNISQMENNDYDKVFLLNNTMYNDNGSINNYSGIDAVTGVSILNNTSENETTDGDGDAGADADTNAGATQ